MKTIPTQQLRPAFPVMVDLDDELGLEDIPDFIVQDPEAVPMCGRYDEYCIDELGGYGFPSCFAERL